MIIEYPDSIQLAFSESKTTLSTVKLRSVAPKVTVPAKEYLGLDIYKRYSLLYVW